MNEKKLREPEEIKKELEQTLKTCILCRSEKERIRSMYNKTIVGLGFCDIKNIQGLRFTIKYSSSKTSLIMQ